MLSLEEGPIGPGAAPDESGLEFNAYTLTGDYSALFAAFILFVETAREGRGLTNAELLTRLRAHIHRGAGTLSVRVKSPADVLRLVS